MAKLPDPYSFYGLVTGADAPFGKFSPGAISVQFTAQSDLRKSRGLYSSVQKHLAEYNRLQRNLIHNEIVNHTKQGIQRGGRASVSTGRLVNALRNPKQVQSAPGGIAQGFSIGDADLLDASEAKYWRAIEYGSAAVWGAKFLGYMVDKDGVPLYGFWGAGKNGFYTNRWGKVLRAGRPYSRYGANRGGKLLPYGQDARKALRNPKTGKAPKRPKRRKHIAPKGSFDYAWDKYGSEVLAKGLVNEIARAAGFVPGT
jgi:hypothetical protein